MTHGRKIRPDLRVRRDSDAKILACCVMYYEKNKITDPAHNNSIQGDSFIAIFC